LLVIDVTIPNSAQSGIQIRPYQNDDEWRVLELLHVALGPGPAGWRAPQFFRWKHMENPFGRSFMLVAEQNARIVGFRAFMRWRFVVGGRAVDAVRAVDTATHPEMQRRGIFSRLTQQALDDLRREVDLVFNTPNKRSGPGYLKLGWRPVGRASISVRVRRPVRVLRGLRLARVDASPSAGPPPAVDADSAPTALEDGDEVESLLRTVRTPHDRLATDRGASFLQWRYGAAPLLGYHAVTERRDGRLKGVALFRVRPRGPLWQSSVADVIVSEGDVRTARALLRRIAVAAPVDYLAFRMPKSSAPARAALRLGFLPIPGGLTLVVNPLTEGLRPDPANPRSWALSLGDLEVF
jgi:GNAT superfamily N-acetyltransferase